MRALSSTAEFLLLMGHRISLTSFLRSIAGYFGALPMQELTGTTALADNVALALGRELLPAGSGNIMNAANWTGVSNPTLSNPSADVLRVAYNGTAGPFANQTVTALSKSYTVAVEGRGDAGLGIPRLTVGSDAVTGTNSVAWQPLGIVYVASFTTFGLQNNAAGAGFAEFRLATVKQTGILDSGDYPGAELLANNASMLVADWTVGNNATLTNPTSDVLRVARSITNNPNANQSVIAIGIRYLSDGNMQARSDGNATPRILDGAAVVWTGTTSTDWQDIDTEFVSAGTAYILQSLTSTGTEYTEWRGASAKTANPPNGDYVGVTLAQPGAGNIPYMVTFDGATSYLDIYSAELNSAFNPDAGTLIVFARVANVGVWTDSATRFLINLLSDAENRININKTTVNGTITLLYEANNVAKSINISGLSTTGLFMLALTWDTVADEVIAYYNGIKQGATQTGLGVWVGNLASSNTTVGAANITPVSVWHGDLAYPILFTSALPQTTIAQVAAAFGVA